MFWRKIINYGGSIGIGGVILYLSLFRSITLTEPPFLWADKVVHLAMYLCLGAALALDMYRAKISEKTLLIATSFICIVYGGVIELLQENFFPPRTGEWLDWLADIAGTFIGVGCIWMIRKYSSTR